jgi:hypothetical protein
MRRPERNTGRLLALAVAGALLYVVGYFAGSRYARPPLEGLGAVVLNEPPMLLPPAGANLHKGWQLAAVGRLDAPGCASVRARMAQIHNRLAARRDLQEALNMQLFAAGAGRSDDTESQVPHIAPLSLEAARDLAAQFGQRSGAPLDCREAPLALVDQSGRLRALLPLGSDPATTATELTQLLDHLQP